MEAWPKRGFLDILAGAIVVSASALAACGGLPQAAPLAPSALYATTTSGQIVGFPVIQSSLGKPFSVSGPANSDGIAIYPLTGLRYAMYVSDPAAGALRVYSISSASDTASPAPVGPYSLGTADGSPGEIFIVAPDLYVATSSGSVAAFAIDPTTGALTPVPGSPFHAGAGVAEMVEAGGNGLSCLFASNTSSQNGSVSAFQIQSNGALVPSPGSPYETLPDGQPTGLYPAVLGGKQYLYAGLANPGDVAAFAVGAGCSLAPVSGSPFAVGQGIQSLLGVPGADSLTLLAMNSANGTVSTLTADPVSGALTQVSDTPLAGVLGSGPAVITQVGPVFIPNSTSDSFAAFSMNNSASGVFPLVPLGGSPYSAGSGTLAMAFLFRPVSDPP